MAKVRETEIVRDADGRVVEREEYVVERPRRRGGGFGWGMLLGIVLISGAIVAFAYNQGSFQEAGLEADQASAQMEETIDTTAENTGDVLENTGDRIEAATDQASNDTLNNSAQN